VHGRIFLLAALLLLIALPCSSESPGVLQGRPAPFFTVESGGNRKLTLDMIRGKVTVIFYETRETSRKNSDAKDRFNVLYDHQGEHVRQSIVRVPVFNCSRVFWPVSLVWKESLKKHSSRVGITLYADWDGRMAADYHMKENESNVVIIDRRGIVRHGSYGSISDKKFTEIEALLDRLVNGEDERENRTVTPPAP
jgi:hypothetical protein